MKDPLELWEPRLHADEADLFEMPDPEALDDALDRASLGVDCCDDLKLVSWYDAWPLSKTAPMIASNEAASASGGEFLHRSNGLMNDDGLGRLISMGPWEGTGVGARGVPLFFRRRRELANHVFT